MGRQGWFGQTRLHSKASKLGWVRRRGKGRYPFYVTDDPVYIQHPSGFFGTKEGREVFQLYTREAKQKAPRATKIWRRTVKRHPVIKREINKVADHVFILASSKTPPKDDLADNPATIYPSLTKSPDIILSREFWRENETECKNKEAHKKFVDLAIKDGAMTEADLRNQKHWIGKYPYKDDPKAVREEKRENMRTELLVHELRHAQEENKRKTRYVKTYAEQPHEVDAYSYAERKLSKEFSLFDLDKDE